MADAPSAPLDGGSGMPGSFEVTTADALSQLGGPDTSAYAVVDDFGFHSTSYAYEDATGATYERNTFQGTFTTGVAEYTAGTYETSGAGPDRTVASQVYRLDTYPLSVSEGYGIYGYGYAYAAGKATEATDTARYASYAGGDEQLSVTAQSSVAYTDGACASVVSDLGETLSDGAVVPGSYALYTLNGYTAYGSGDTSYTPDYVTR